MPTLLLFLIVLACNARDAEGATIYRLGTPFSDAEKDSLDGIGVDFREIAWIASQLEEALELDSLQAGSLQPNFFDEDEDIAATLLSRGGTVWVDIRRGASHANSLIGQVLLDEDSATGYVFTELAAESLNRDIWERVTLRLGGRFFIREVRLRTPPDMPELFLQRVAVGVGEEISSAARIPQLPVIAEVAENIEPEFSVLLDPPVTTRFVQLLIFRQTTKAVGLADLEIYGGGFVGQASYESDVIELDDVASWGELRWSGRRDPQANIDIRTRSGADPQPDIFWEARPEQQDSVKFLGGGGDLSFTEYRREYDRLSDILKPPEEQGGVSPDTENWSFWSSPYAYDNSGAAIVSPAPRQFIQIKADFASTIEDGGKLDYVEFKASVPPAVRDLVGEIFPAETDLGDPTHFTYYIKPTIRSGDRSFDAIEISTPSGIVSIDSLRLDEVDQGAVRSTKHADGLGFDVMLPRRLDLADSGTLVEVVFNAPVLREVGTVFEGRVYDTSSPHEVRQLVIPGDANSAVESDRLSVTTALSRSVVFSPRVSPNPFTPNGDGINDVANISYKLLRVTSAVPVVIEVFDLSGRLVKQVYAGDDPLGEYSHVWDGTDRANRLVPPGLYLYRIAADVQSQHETNNGILSVAY